MDLKQLRSFLHVAETGSLSQAAKRLHITQPALSRQIRLMEEECATPLFTRTGRGVVLNDAGKMLEPRIRLIAEEVQRLKVDMTALAGTIRGEVRLGLPPSVGAVLAGPIIQQFHQQYPQVRLRVTQLLSGALQDALLDGRLDMGILFEGSVSPALKLQRLWSEKLFVITAANGPYADAARITPELAFQSPLILPGPKHGLRTLLEKEAQRRDCTLNVILEADSLAILLELTERGLGNTILSIDACTKAIEQGRLRALPFENAQLQRNCALVWPRDFPLTQAAQAMADVIKQTSEDLHAASHLPQMG